jgi:hypothetical protein
MSKSELLLQELLEQIPAVYSGAKTPLKDKIIKVKYFSTNFIWLVTECEVHMERRGGDG